MPEGPAGTLNDLLMLRRQRRFVGRSEQIDLFRSALASAEPVPSVLFLHGPGGIGKTSLLDVFADVAAESGLIAIRIDGRDMPPAPADLLEALGAGLGVLPDDDVLDALSAAGRMALFLDGFERLVPLDGWLRTRLLPRLPATAVVVIAGRTPPAPPWRVDPAWRDVTQVIALRNLAPKESREYLQECGVDPAFHDRMVEVSHGHPLGLSLLTDVVGRGGATIADPLRPDLVTILVSRFIDTVPSALHRRALEVCALSRVTTETLLRDALELSDAHDLFAWLRDLSFVESGPDGLFPHELARDALAADLHWRDPETYHQVFRGIRAHIISRLKTTAGRQQQRVLLDAKFMHRHQPISRVWADWETLGRNYPEPARPDDGGAILDLVATWEGEASAAIAQRWWCGQPDAFQVVRHHDGQVRGFIAQVDLTRATPADLAADPVARVAWEYAQRHGSPVAGEVITQARFAIDREAYQGPSPTMNLAPVLSIQSWVTTPKLPMSFITMSEPERWDEFFAFFEIHRVATADVEIHPRRYGLFVRDFRRLPVNDWLELMLERDLTGDYRPSPAASPSPVLVLSQPEFDEAVRFALRDFRRKDLLARNPLLRSPVVLARTGSSDAGPDALVDLLREAAEQLREDPRDEKLYRVIDRTFLRPAASQEKAAELLDLPLSTYKRHLRRAVARLVADLWDREIRAAHPA